MVEKGGELHVLNPLTIIIAIIARVTTLKVS